jgi:ABC-type transport system involved in multi-copper enzyme maturation permease subunit
LIPSFAAEWFKLRRRPAIWVVGAILLAILILLGYFGTWLVISHPPRGAHFRFNTNDAIGAYYPTAFVRETISIMSELGAALSLLLGVLAVGSEYGWGTLKAILTHGPGRLATFAGRTLAVGLIVLIYVVALFLAAAICSAIIGAIDHQSLSNWPSTIDILKALAATWLIFATWASFGMMLAYLFRQSALAIGLGLVYLLLLENIFTGLVNLLGGDYSTDAKQLLPVSVGGALSASFGAASRFVAASSTTAGPVVSADRAVITLCIYLVAFLVIGATVFRARDVT